MGLKITDIDHDSRFAVIEKQPQCRWSPAAVADPDKVPPRMARALLGCVKGQLPWPLLVLGDVGVGKTRFGMLVHDRYGGRFDDFVTYVDEFRMVKCGEFRDVRWTTFPRVYERDWIQMIREHRMLVVDDIGRRLDEKDHPRDTLIRLLNCREDGKPMVLTSNLSLAALAENYDDRIASRMSAGTVVDIKGEDQRTSRMVVQ